MATLTEAMQHADSETDLSTYMTLVKAAVIASIHEVDPTAQIKDTGYFNHSAVPDLVLGWSGRPDRPLYVRRSYDEMAATHDVNRLAKTMPVLLSVGPAPADSRERAEVTLGITRRDSRRVLVTEAAAMDALSTGHTSAGTPIGGAVTAAILPSGQGVLDAETAARLLTPSGQLTEVLADILSPEAVASVSRMSDVIAAAAGGQVPTDITEPFTIDEARELLPWLLQSDLAPTPQFWRFVAERLSLKHLEALASELAGLDLTALCRPGAAVWEAPRAALGSAPPSADGEDVEVDGWRMQGKLLTCEVGGRAFRFATYGQAIKEHGSLSSATWEAIRPGIDEGSTRHVVLRGLARSIRVNAEESTDVQADVESIVNTVVDQYYVDEVTVRYGTDNEPRRVRVVIGDGIAYNLQSASVRDLMIALANIAAYRVRIDIANMITEVS